MPHVRLMLALQALLLWTDFAKGARDANRRETMVAAGVTSGTKVDSGAAQA